ncbi:BatA domain-containing protein [Planctomycetota bacterium]
MIFSTPIFLYFLPAAGLPVIFHLFLKQKKRQLLFPTLMFFHMTDPKLNSRRKVHQLLLLLMRVLLIAFILLALSRPKFQSSVQMGGKISAVVVVDNSGSMSDIAGDEKTKLEFAVEGAKRLVSLLGDSAGMNIVTLVEDPAVVSNNSLTSDTESLLTLLDTITPTDATGSAGNALAKAFRLLQADSARGGVVHVFSDLQEAEWADETLQSESADDLITIILHRIESKTRLQANVSISSIQFPRQKILARHPLKIGVVCTNNSAAVANIRVNSIDNQDKKSTQKIVLEPGRSQTVEVAISPDTPGYHWLKTWIEGDGFAADNQASTGIVCGQTATVLFAGSPGEFGVLPTAFSPDNYGQLTGMISKFSRSGQIPQAQGEKPILIVTTWEEIGKNNQVSSDIRQYVEAGGNLLIVPSARRAGTNAKPPVWLGAGTKSRLSNARGIKVESMTKESGFWSRIREATGTASPDNVTVFTYQPLELSEDYTPLLGIDFERVVFAHRELGSGNIYVSGTAFDPRWNTLPLSGLIVVMAQSIAVEGTALEEEAMLSLVAGESPKGINAGGQQVEVTCLTGDEFDLKGQAIDMPVFSKSGVYLVKAGNKEFCVSVHSSPKEGLTQFLQGSKVPAMEKITHSVVDYNPADDLQKYHAGQSRTFEMFLPLVLLATMVLLVEGWLANPIRARAEKTSPSESTQAAGQSKKPGDVLSTSGQEVLVSGGAG